MYSIWKCPVNNCSSIQACLSCNNVLLLLQAFDTITLQRYTLYQCKMFHWNQHQLGYLVLYTIHFDKIGHMVPFCVDGHIIITCFCTPVLKSNNDKISWTPHICWFLSLRRTATAHGRLCDSPHLYLLCESLWLVMTWRIFSIVGARLCSWSIQVCHWNSWSWLAGMVRNIDGADFLHNVEHSVSIWSSTIWSVLLSYILKICMVHLGITITSLSWFDMTCINWVANCKLMFITLVDWITCLSSSGNSATNGLLAVDIRPDN